MSKHTAGPWRSSRKTSRTNNLGIYDADGYLLASLDVHQIATAEVIKRREADARLMAAAPVLLDRLARTNSTCRGLVERLLPHWKALEANGDPNAESLRACIDMLYFTAEHGNADIITAIAP